MSDFPSKTAPDGRWYHEIWFVLLMLFVLAGPLAFPLLWKSPHFSRAVKVALTAIVILFTAWVLVKSVELALQMVHELQTMPMP